MAYQGMNYAAIPVQKPVDLFGSVMEGYQAVSNIKSQKQKQEQQDLANKMAQMQLQNAPEEAKRRQELQAAQLRNELARAGMMEQQAKAYPKKSQMQQALLNAQMQNYQAQAQRNQALAQQSQADLKQQQELAALMSRAKGVPQQPEQAQQMPQQMQQQVQQQQMPEAMQQDAQQMQQATPPAGAQTQQLHPKAAAEYLQNKYKGSTVVNEGNPDAYHIDEIAEAHPDFKAILQNKYKFPAEKIESKYNSDTGNIDTITTKGSGLVLAKSVPFGISPSEAEAAKERAKDFAKLDVNSAERYLKTAEEARKMTPQIDALVDMTKKPEFNLITGPIGSGIAKNLGGTEAKKMFGTMSALLGQIKMTASTNFKGAYKDSINSIIDDIKPTMGDYPDVFRGKLSALKMMNDASINYGESVASYIRQGMPAEKATQQAQKDFKQTADLAKKLSKGSGAGKQGVLKLNMSSGRFE